MLAFAVLALVAGTVITYWPVRHYAFVQLDDPLYVTENAPVLAGLTWTSVTWAFTTTHGGYWIPLTWLSYMLDVELFGASPGAMHVVNLAMHCVNAVLLLLLLSHLTGSLWRSAFVAAAFALHPLHVESVAWITERKDVLSTLFFLSAVAAYVAWVRRKHRVRHAAVLVCFGLSIMAKPMMVSFPLVLLLLDVWPLGRLRMGTKALPAQLGYLAREKTLIFAVAAAASVLAYLTQQWSGIVVDLEALPIDVRLENALVSMMRYVGKMCWPTDLSVAYFRLPNPFWWAVGAAAALVTISRLVVRQARRRPYLLVGWLWFLVTLVPVAGFVQIGVQSMADRFSYVTAHRPVHHARLGRPRCGSMAGRAMVDDRGRSHGARGLRDGHAIAAAVLEGQRCAVHQSDHDHAASGRVPGPRLARHRPSWPGPQ